jgi:hypothetical protein
MSTPGMHPLRTGSFCVLRRSEGGTRRAPSASRPIGRPCTNGTRQRSRTPASETCRCTRSDTPQPLRG